MNALFELTIVKSKLIIKQLRAINIYDLVPVRETLNSIDFILDDDDQWDYAKLPKICVATTKVRVQDADKIEKFIQDNKSKIRLDAIDSTFLSDLLKVHKIKIKGKTEDDLKLKDKESFADTEKEKILLKIKETIININNLAETMGGIL